MKFLLASALALVLTGDLSSSIAVSAPARAVFLCPDSDTIFGVAGGNTTAAQAANTVAGTIEPERTPMQGLHHSQKSIDMKNTKRGAKRPADVDAAGVNLNEVLVASPSSELEVRLWKDGTVEFRTIENEAGICTTRP